MKNQVFKPALLASALLIILTAGAQVRAADTAATTSATLEDSSPARLSDLGTHINPQIGMASMEYSGRNSTAQRLTGGATAEFGEGIRRMETGLLLLQAGGKLTLANGTETDVHSTYIAIPMLAKIRIFQMSKQAWYLKGGVLTAFEVGSNHNGETNNLDVLASLGLAGRFALTKNADFIVEGSYNRGLLPALRTSSNADSYNQGALVLAGMSFKL